MLVKICGITRLEDAEAAVSLGAGALGFNFWRESRRFIDPYLARAIVSALPPFVTPVGVFVNPSLEYVRGVARLVPLGAIQLHGDETPEFAAQIDRPIVKALRIGEAVGGEEARWPASVTVLLDAEDAVHRGGTGRTIDWRAAASVAAHRRVILAGGLTPENVADAVRGVRPFGVDVASGVESQPGRKDHTRLAEFFDALAGVSELRSKAPVAQGHER